MHTGSQPTTAWTTSLLQPARAPAQHAAQSGVRNKSGSPSSTAAAATVTPSGKTTQPPEQRRVTPTSTPKSESSAAPAIQADSYSHCTEVGLGSECNSSATSTPVRLAGSPAKGPASGHGSVALLPQSTSAQKVPMQQEQTRKPRGHSASALLPAPKAHLPATCTANAVPDRKVGAHIPPVQPSMQEGIKQDKDTLLMVRRLPAVLTGTLPTLESLGVQLHLPSGATLLSKASYCCTQPYTVLAFTIVCFCPPSMHCSMCTSPGSIPFCGIQILHLSSLCNGSACLNCLCRATAQKASGSLCRACAALVSSWNGQGCAEPFGAASRPQ